MRGRFPGYDGDVTPKVYEVCTECGRRVDWTNVLMVDNGDGTWRCWNVKTCAEAAA